MKAKEQVKTDLLTFLDDFAEFNDRCSFLCDAIPALFVDYAQSEIDSHTIQGVRRYCSDIKAQAESLEAVLNTLYQPSYTD